MKKKALFLGETYRADALTWMNGLREFGDFEIISWELETPSNSFTNRILRLLEFVFCIFKIRKIVAVQKPDIVVAERVTSYGFLAAISGAKIIVIAQQGISDLWPEDSMFFPVKKIMQHYAFKKATLVHAWGEVMLPAMIAAKVPEDKILVLPKGIDLRKFYPTQKPKSNIIHAIVTRSLLPEYGHECILKAFGILKSQDIPFQLTIVGDGKMKNQLEKLAFDLKIEKETNFLGRIKNDELPTLLQQNQFYISMPNTEGVSASLFEAMACQCYPIVSNIPGNVAFIKNKENGILVNVGSAEQLAVALCFAFENQMIVKQTVLDNFEFIKNSANYQVNMAIISEKYHEIIKNN